MTSQTVVWTETEVRILKVLSDGHMHEKAHLQKCVNDELSTHAVNSHLRNIRRKLRPIGEDIICQFYDKKLFYRHVRLLTSPTNGYK